MSPDSRIKRLALGTASIFLLIVGTLLSVPQMYLMAVAISLVPLVFWAVGLGLLQGISCDRKMPGTCQRGDRVKVDLVLTNNTPFSKFYVRALDKLPRWVRFDGYASDHSSILLNLRPKEQAKFCYYIRPLRRGLQSIGPTKLSNPDLIGLSSYSRTVNSPIDLLVYPEIIPVNPLFLNGGGAHGWMDQENAATRGAGTDFQGVREYRTGDELRRVNWKTTARTGSLAVTEYALGYVSDLSIAIDLSEDSYGQDSAFDSAFETAIQIAASIAVAGLKQGSQVDLLTNVPLPGISGPLRGPDSAVTVLTAFASIKPQQARPFSAVLNEFSQSNSIDRSLIVITPWPAVDSRLGGTLESISDSRKGIPSLVFCIDTDAYSKSLQFQYLAPPQQQRSSARVTKGHRGITVTINPNTDLRDLFARTLA